MMLFLFFLVVIIFVIIILFAFPQFSPIPYFPSNKEDTKIILKAFNVKNDQIIFDLGAGDGWVIFMAAKEAYRKKLNTQFVAVDINPILIIIMHIRRLFHPNKKNIKIVWGDMFKIDFNSLTRLPTEASAKVGKPVNSKTFYLYISPWYLEKIIKNLKLKIENFSVVSYMYPIKSLSKFETIIKGNKHNIFIYSKI